MNKALLVLTKQCLEKPGYCVAVVLVLTLVLAGGLFRLKIRTDGEMLYPDHHPVVTKTQLDRTRFDDPETVLVLVQSRDGGNGVATLDGFLYLEQVHRDLNRLPAVAEDGVLSLVTQLDIPENPNLRCLPTFFSSVPTSPWAFELLLKRIRDFPFANGFLLSEDGSTASLAASKKEGVHRAELVGQLRDWIGNQNHPQYRLSLLGPLVAEVSLGEMVLRDLGFFIPIMVPFVALILFFSLRTVGAVMLTLVEVALVLVWTFGAMGYLGIPITLVTSILPVILMTMAVTDEIHFFERFQRLPGFCSIEEPGQLKNRVLQSLGQVGTPIIATSLTTAVGFLSFVSASVAPIRHFGIFTALGILVAMILSFTVIPALLMVLPATWFGTAGKRSGQRKVLLFYEKGLVAYPGRAFLLGFLLIAFALPGWWRLEVRDAWMTNFDPESPLVQADREFNRHFWGAYRHDLVLEAEPGFFASKQGVALVGSLCDDLAETERVGGVVSYLTLLQRIADLQKKQGPVAAYTAASLTAIFDVLPYLAQAMNLSRFLSPKRDRVRLQVYVNQPDYQVGLELQEKIARLMEDPGRASVSYHESGDLPLAVAVVGSVVTNLIRSVVWTVVVIFLLLWVWLRSFPLALCAMIPTLAATLVVLGFMGLTGMDLGIASCMITALTIGVGIDFSLHLIFGYRRLAGESPDETGTLKQTIATTGTALRWNATVLALGFSVLVFSALKPNNQLGLLLALAMVAAYFSGMTLLPWFLTRFFKPKKDHL